ncbi:hypothetical protein V1505DRAFT_284529, partial [Lipomyces doorenjongii]
LTHWAKENTIVSIAAILFWAGGLSAQIFWILAYSSDVVERTIMTDDVTKPRHKTWIDGARYVHNEK